MLRRWWLALAFSAVALSAAGAQQISAPVPGVLRRIRVTHHPHRGRGGSLGVHEAGKTSVLVDTFRRKSNKLRSKLQPATI